MTTKVIYKGGLRTEAIHSKSKNILITDAPTDNNGQGAAFSPTDLLATALASCMLTIMGIVAERNTWNIDETYAKVVKVMVSGPRRIQGIEIKMYMPADIYTKRAKEVLEHAARTCPVALSLSRDLEQTVEFIWP